jgi:hypothetical protein
MDAYVESNLSYMTPVGSYIHTLSPLTPLKDVELDDGTEEYLKTLDKNIKRLTLSERNIKNINSIIRFPNIIKLDISRTGIRDISYIPETIEIFICCRNFLSKCPQLNKNLKILDLGYNSIKDMPEFTPNLEYVNVDNNGLKLFRNFNHGLQYLSAKNNNLIRLPFLPDTLRILHVDNNNNLKIIPILPESLDICSMTYTKIFNNIVNIYHDVYEEEIDKYNMECIKNYIKTINVNIMKNKSWFRKYIWYIREKIIKTKFSPNKLNIHLENYKSGENFKPGTVEWFDEMINNWSNENDYDHIFDNSYNINYTRNNDQMYNGFVDFYTDNPYLMNICQTIIPGEFDNDKYYDYSGYEQYEYEDNYYYDDYQNNDYNSELDDL